MSRPPYTEYYIPPSSSGGKLPVPPSFVGGGEGPPQKCEALREAYKRHCSELATIDDQQVKLLAVILGIFSAGATFLASPSKNRSMSELHWPVKLGLTIIALVLAGQSIYYSQERHEYRQAVRDLLVRCEMALGFYAKDAYLAGEPLYTPYELDFASRGQYVLRNHIIIVCSAAVGFLFVLWANDLSSHLPSWMCG